MHNLSRREFLKSSVAMAGLSAVGAHSYCNAMNSGQVQVCGHLWIYASRYPPNWDCTPILEQVFSDFAYAGMEGLEMMESNLHHSDVVQRVKELTDKYKVPVTGTSYGADMWKASEHSRILDDISIVLERLHEIGGATLGITVGNARRLKTVAELDAQAELLKQIMKVCEKYRIQPNIHNHTFEVENNMHDLKGIMERVPEIKLGPDLNWLIRGGIDPVWFIKTYGKRMAYMHIRDQKADGKWTEALGEGVTDFPAIAKALHDINYSGRAAIELALEGAPQREVKESWKISREYVKKVFAW